MPLSTSNGFSEEEINQCQGWSLPDISNGGEISAKVDKQGIIKKNQRAVESTDQENIETVEDVDPDIIETTEQVISAEQLQEITEVAEKEGYETGFTQGLEKGKEQGLASGLQEGRQVIAEQSQRLQHLIDALLTPLENEKKTIEALLLDITCRLTETLIERELKTNSKQIIALIDQLLTLLPQSTTAYTLYLNPEDIRLVETHLKENSSLSAGLNAEHFLEVDKNLLPGGCRLESSHASIDATVETKIKTLLDDFIQKRHSDQSLDQAELDEVSEKPPVEGRRNQENDDEY